MPLLRNSYEQSDFGIEKRADIREVVVGLGDPLIRPTRIKKRCVLDREKGEALLNSQETSDYNT